MKCPHCYGTGERRYPIPPASPGLVAVDEKPRITEIEIEDNHCCYCMGTGKEKHGRTAWEQP